MSLLLRLVALIVLPAVWLAGCTGYAPTHLQAGSSAADAVRELGNPSGRYDMPGGGTRLEFARGPFGKHTFMVDLDPHGRVTGWRQVLSEADFNRIRTGETAAQVLREIGRPSERSPGGWQGGQVWSYRYETVFCQWFQLSMDAAGVVTGTGYGPDPLCDVNLRDGNDR